MLFMTSNQEIKRLRGLVLSWKSHATGLEKMLDILELERDNLRNQLEGYKISADLWNKERDALNRSKNKYKRRRS